MLSIILITFEYMTTKFYKYQATGNDFVIIDLRENKLQIDKEHIKKICDRKFGIGSDGLMLIKKHKNVDFEMEFYNPDGSKSFCGNGSRCAVLFNYHQGFTPKNCCFITNDGEHQGYVADNESVKISILGPVSVNKLSNGDYEVNTGSPHYIQYKSKIKELDFISYCKSIRNNDLYLKDGINVNLVENNSDSLFMRTYERGVENETLSCGSGVTAVALAHGMENSNLNSVEVKTLGGNLKVEFQKKSNLFSNVFLSGPSSFVFSGEINI